MAFPIILVNSATGSDSLASGAGPGTALTGTAGATDAAGTLVTLDGSPDLTAVATDGSHVIYLEDTTAGARNFGKITAKDNGAKTVTVSNAFGLSLSGLSWAIGGKRASVGSTTSKKLFDNNAAAGDAMPGWIVEMESGHAETLSAQYILRRAGDTTDGPIILRGVGATYPILTFTNNGDAINPSAVRQVCQHFELRNTNATKTASRAVLPQFSNSVFMDLRIAHATDSFWKGIVFAVAAEGIIVRDCAVMNCANIGITVTGATTEVRNCLVKGNGSHGLILTGALYGVRVIGNIFAANTGDGVNDASTASAGRNTVAYHQNTFDANTSDGLEKTATAANRPFEAGIVENNIFSNNGGYGVNFSGASVTDVFLRASAGQIRNNNHYLNTSGFSNITFTFDENTTNLDPSYTSTASDDYSIGTNLKAKGHPLGGTSPVGAGSATYSYVDTGAAQRQEPAGGGGSTYSRGRVVNG